MDQGMSGGVATRTCLGCSGLLTSWRVSIKAPSWSGSSAMWSLIIALAVVLPTLSQWARTELQVCLTNISSQWTMAAVAKLVSSTMNKKDSAKCQWFPYRLRAGRTAGNSRGHSFLQAPECGNEFNQAWESCTTTGWSGDHITQKKWHDFQEELISTLKNHMQVIVILLMQSGTTFAWINQPLWHHLEMVPSCPLFSLVSYHWLCQTSTYL